MRLSGRRFPDSITRQREGPGHFNDHGEFVPGMTLVHAFKANVQPLSLTDDLLSEGARIMSQIKLYVPIDESRPGETPLRAAATTANPDMVTWRSATYRVEESWFWGDHVRATATLVPA